MYVFLETQFVLHRMGSEADLLGKALIASLNYLEGDRLCQYEFAVIPDVAISKVK